MAAENQIKRFAVEASSTSCKYSKYYSPVKFKAKRGHKIALCFNVAPSSMFSSSLESTATVLARISRVGQDGQVVDINFGYIQSTKLYDWYASHTFSQSDVMAAKWTIEVIDLMGNSLVKQTFEATD
jgi:hypothetical protein